MAWCCRATTTQPIRLTNNGQVVVEADGTVRSGNEVAGKLKIVDFDDYAVLAREEGARFRAARERGGPHGVADDARAFGRAGAVERRRWSSAWRT